MSLEASYSQVKKVKSDFPAGEAYWEDRPLILFNFGACPFRKLFNVLKIKLE